MRQSNLLDTRKGLLKVAVQEGRGYCESTTVKVANASASLRTHNLKSTAWGVPDFEI